MYRISLRRPRRQLPLRWTRYLLQVLLPLLPRHRLLWPLLLPLLRLLNLLLLHLTIKQAAMSPKFCVEHWPRLSNESQNSNTSNE